MADMYVRYEIEDPKTVYKPGDQIRGVMYVESKESKPKKLKSVSIRIMEYWTQKDSFAKSFAKDFGGNLSGNLGVGFLGPSGANNNPNQKFNKLKSINLDKKSAINPGETKKYEFTIDLPLWEPKTGKRQSNWYIMITFLQRTGTVPTPGNNPYDGIFILPVEGMDIPIDIFPPELRGQIEEILKNNPSLKWDPFAAPVSDAPAPAAPLTYENKPVNTAPLGGNIRALQLARVPTTKKINGKMLW